MFPIRDHNPAERTPFITYGLIALNIVIFLVTLLLARDERALALLYFEYGLVPARLTAGEGQLGLFTSMFMHAGFMHLAGNMLFLWIFGDNMEDQMGHLPFLAFYIVSGLGATYAHYVLAPLSQVPLVGASGAIAGVMGGYLLLFPKAKVDIFVFLIIIIRVFPIPSWIMLGLWFGMQIFNGVGSSVDGGGVAYWAHAGGFIIGIVLTFPLWLKRGAGGFWARTDGHPDHPEATYPMMKSRVPKVTRK